MAVKNQEYGKQTSVVPTGQEDPFRLRKITLGGDTPSLASEVAFELRRKARTAGSTEDEHAGDRKPT